MRLESLIGQGRSLGAAFSRGERVFEKETKGGGG